MIFSRFLLHLLTYSCLLSLLNPTYLAAAPQSKGGPVTRSLRGSQTLDQDIYSFGLGEAVTVFGTSTDTSLYDPVTIATLKSLKENLKPILGPDDIDPDETRHAVERALAIQSGLSISQLIEKSELRSTFRSVKAAVKDFQDIFRYSVQTDGEGVTLSKSEVGHKLLEFNVEINLKQGLDPQMKIGENFRFRYDYIEQRPMFEYGLRF